MLATTTPIGVTDLPYDPCADPEADHNALGISNYLDGLAQFITSCPTPMTIAVQGDWGSGKTSAMNGIKFRLGSEKKYEIIDFNTWQYAQFDLGEALVFSLVHEVTAPLQRNSEQAKRYLRKFVDFGRGLMRTVGSTTPAIAVLSNVLDSAVDSFGDDEKMSIVEQVKNLRKEFHAAVEEFCKKAEKDRVIVFVDDLDRLDPSKSVEVMENLKLFLECERVVFVLAIDFEVVSRGVQNKFGAGFTEDKARSFFDKIIQVPFRMPISNYKIDGIMKEVFDTLGMKNLSAAERKPYEQAVKYSIGTNPRSLKRLLNTFVLLKLIVEAGELPSERDDKLDITLFYLLCLQSAFPKFHDRLTELSDFQEDLDSLLPIDETGDDTQGTTTAMQKEYGVTTLDQLRRLESFIEFFREVLDDSDDGLQLLKRGLFLSSVTTVGSSNVVDNDGRRDFGGSVISRLESNLGTPGTTMFQSLLAKLCNLLGEEQFSYAMTPSSDNTVTLHNRSEESVKKSGWGTQMAEVRVNKRGTLAVYFGPKAAEGARNFWKNDPEWSKLAEGLHREWHSEAEGRGNKKMTFLDTNKKQSRNTHPFGLTKISTEEEIEAVALALSTAFKLSRR